MTKFLDRPDLDRHHARLHEYRDTLLAHTDLSPHREAVVFPSGGVLKTPLVTEGRSPIGQEGIRELRELFRMTAEALELVERLEKLEGWEPDQEVRLCLEDV